MFHSDRCGVASTLIPARLLHCALAYIQQQNPAVALRRVTGRRGAWRDRTAHAARLSASEMQLCISDYRLWIHQAENYSGLSNASCADGA